MSWRANNKATLTAVACAASLACGPFFPNRYLVQPESMLLASPIGDFGIELDRIRIKHPADPAPIFPKDKRNVYEQSAEIDVAELKAYLASADLPEQQRTQTLATYQAIRTAIAAHADDPQDKKTAAMLALPPPPDFDNEFGQYLSALILFHQNHRDAAIAIWQAILNRPPQQRQWRSTWSAFMLGKAQLDSNPAAAVQQFHLTRELAVSGFHDPLGLAAASIGWEAKAELNQKHFVQAIELYLRQRDTGDTSAASSLCLCAGDAFETGGDALRQVASSRAACEVMAAYLIADQRGTSDDTIHPKPDNVIAWLQAVEAANLNPSPSADRLAWAAYSAGQFPAARRWLARANARSPITQWVGAKLAFHDGKIDRAIELLSQASNSFPLSEEWKGIAYGEEESQHAFPARDASAELAVLKLSRGQYIQTLDLFLRADRDIDAAFVAEQVLSIDELKTYVDAHRKSQFISELLARRLMRAGKCTTATVYFRPQLAREAIEYADAITLGHDVKRSQSDRAAAFWKAAQLARYRGQDLLATEEDPDWRILGLSFELDPAASARKVAATHPLARATRDELRRIENSATPSRRWHYRYTAVDLAWHATQLMPDESDDTAAALIEAGTWIKANDPRGADRFYKSLVRRCGSTALGNQAAKLKWFPTLPGKNIPQ